MHEDIVEKLFQEYTVHGFIFENNIFDLLEENGVSLFDVESICDHLLSKGAIIKEVDKYDGEENEYDRSNIDYEEVFNEIIEIDDSLTGLIEYIRSIQPPQHREWQNLMLQVKLNNAYARKRIFEMYMKVTVRIALVHSKRYQLPLDDTIQNAFMGLHIAIGKYKIARQENFASYFPWWIRQYIMRGAQTPNPLVYFPAHIKEKLFAIYDNMDNYFNGIEDRTNPDNELLQRISTELQCTLDNARQLFDYLVPFESLEKLLEDEENEILFTDNGINQEEMVEDIERELDAEELRGYLHTLLKPREEDVMKMRYGIGFSDYRTLEEIGMKLNLTRERIRQIEAKCLRRLRKRYRLNGNWQ